MKYDESKELFYKRDINGILAISKQPKIIKMTYDIFYYYPKEWLTRLYEPFELPGKIDAITKFYKFHNPKPLFFDSPHDRILSDYYRNRKRAGFKDIAKEIKNELKLENKTPEDENMGYLNDYYTIYIDECKYSAGYKGKLILKNLTNDTSIRVND
jgi:hypothetical protein